MAVYCLGDALSLFAADDASQGGEDDPAMNDYTDIQPLPTFEREPRHRRRNPRVLCTVVAPAGSPHALFGSSRR